MFNDVEREDCGAYFDANTHLRALMDRSSTSLSVSRNNEVEVDERFGGVMKRNCSEFALLSASLTFILILASCSSSPSLQYIMVSPASTTISAGTTQQYTATGYYSNGSVSHSISVTWLSSASGVATIDPTGVATAVAAGSTSITATALGITSSSVTLDVQQLVSITISPANPTVPLGGTQQFMATAIYKNPDGSTTSGTAGALTGQVTWTAASTSLLTFSTSIAGLATGVSEGPTSVSALFDGVTGTTSLTVGAPIPQSIVIAPLASPIAVGNAVALSAQEVWTDGSKHRPSGTVVWSSDTSADANVVASSSYTALAAGFAVGAANISAKEGSLTSGTASLAVVTGSTHFAYVSNYGDSTVSEYTVNATASPYLTPSGTVATSTLRPSQTVIDPNGKYLYLIAAGSDTNVTVFNVTSTGALNSAGFAPEPAGPVDVNYGVIDPYGRYLYVADYTANCIYGFQISQTDGSLTPITGSPFTTNVSGPLSMVADHSGQYLYVVNSLSSKLSAYQIDQTLTASGGALTPLVSQATISTGTAPGISTLDPTGAYLYVPNNVDGTVSSYSIATTGELTNLATTTVTGAVSILNVAVDPAGKYLYVLDAGILPANGALYGFTLSSGLPSTIPTGPPVATGLAPEGIAIDPTDNLIAVENSSEGGTPSTISLFSISPGGVLSPQTPVATGVNPLFVTFYNAP
jgi:6-phosphogluconolactonase (cycloisomerase 2 family)